MRRNTLGMSLAEVLLAIVLFALMAYSLAAVWVTHSRVLMKSQRLFAATEIAEARLTEQLGLGFRSVARSGVARVRRSVDTATTLEEYRWTVTVLDTNQAEPELKHIKVQVEWDEPSGKKSVQLVTSVYWQG